MLAVIGVIGLLLGLTLPAIGPLKGSQDVTTAAYNFAGALETARNYAISNDTYTWVGFYEQDYSNVSAPAIPAPPKYPGIGHITVGIVFSRDGTNLEDTPVGTLPDARLGPVGKLMHIYAVHLTALDKPGAENSDDPAIANTLQGRPYQSDLENSSDPSALEQTLISSDSDDKTVRPFKTQGYTFYKTVRFNPRGEANINGSLPCTRIIEFGLRPTHGNVTNSTTPNVVAVQQAGIGGAVNIYRP